MYLIESRAHRLIGPGWYLEGTFETQDDAEVWLSKNERGLRASFSKYGMPLPEFRIRDDWKPL